ncbi:hypothetical protein Tco_1203502 [Tanacetum coccineum]
MITNQHTHRENVKRMSKDLKDKDSMLGLKFCKMDDLLRGSIVGKQKSVGHFQVKVLQVLARRIMFMLSLEANPGPKALGKPIISHGDGLHVTYTALS